MSTVGAPPQRDVAAAYAYCERITRREAANFYWGIRLLPAQRRRAMSAVYAFARRIDDIGDGTLASDEKSRLLDAESTALRGLRAAAGAAGAEPAGVLREDPVLSALGDAMRRFPLPLDALEELIEGVRMDVEGTRYETFEEMELYCRRVAGTIGRLCLAIFGLRAGSQAELGPAAALADDLGVALQLTNILRDVHEDAAGGRVYLPLEDLRRFGLISASAEQPPDRALVALVERATRTTGSAPIAGAASGPPGDGRGPPGDGHQQRERLAAMMRFEAERARSWFERGIALAPLLDRRSAACLLAMAGIYRRVLERIDADPVAALQRRVSLPVREKAAVALRGMLAARR
jgi:phytoene synthase